MMPANITIPNITDDCIFKESSYSDFVLECRELLEHERVDKKAIKSKIATIKGYVEANLGKRYWNIFNTLDKTDICIKELVALDEDTSIVLDAWNTYIEPLIIDYFWISKESLKLDTGHQETPLRVKIFCDILLRKEYSFNAYSSEHILRNTPIFLLKQTSYINHEHAANLKLLLADESRALDATKLCFVVNEYSYAAQLLWSTLTPLNKTNLISNVITFFSKMSPNTPSTETLTHYLSELTKYNDFKTFIQLHQMFGVTDINSLSSIFSGTITNPPLPLPELL